MRQKLYSILIEPNSKDLGKRNSELILNWILLGILALLLLSGTGLAISIFVKQDFHVLQRLFILSLMLVVFSVSYYFVRKHYNAQLIARWAIVVFFYSCSMYTATRWGIVNPFGVLLFALTIILSGILLGSKFSFIAIGVTTISLLALQQAKYEDIIRPNMSWLNDPSSFVDAIVFSSIFFILGIVSWLFNKQMEDSLKRAQESEQALKIERDLLEIKVTERTRELQEAQLEKIQHIYKFAELGHLSTALFHDLAGNLSSLSLDIESMRKKNKTEFSKRIDENIRYIDNVVKRVKSQIQGKSTDETFNVTSSVKDLVGILSYNARQARTHIIFEAPSLNIFYTGNLTRFRQLIINLLSNAIEAYPKNPHASVKDRPVVISIKDTTDALEIKVSDHGKGITRTSKQKIFDPFFTTKVSGSGIGLFIVKQVTENDFGGSIKLSSSKKVGTTFTVTLPKNEG